MKEIAIIGGGVVGVTAAYYLSKNPKFHVTVFDDGIGQATKAAAGIISPWFSKRRHKAWYRLARLGADFYVQLINDLEKSGADTSFYQQTGTYLLKKKEEMLEDLYHLAVSRRQESPLIGDLDILSKNQANRSFPDLDGFSKLLYASGGARVDGYQLTKSLFEVSQVTFVQEKVDFQTDGQQYIIRGQIFDSLILATGAWVGELLTPLGYEVDVRPQKGQLCDYYFDNLITDDYPVVMPEGELDIIPFNNGRISVGASHENNKGFDLSVDTILMTEFELKAQVYFPKISQSTSKESRVGIRAYTSDYSPFFGEVPDLPNVYVASGLGSTGLTIGPLIGNQLAKLVSEEQLDLNLDDYPVRNYIIRV